MGAMVAEKTRRWRGARDGGGAPVGAMAAELDARRAAGWAGTARPRLRGDGAAEGGGEGLRQVAGVVPGR